MAGVNALVQKHVIVFAPVHMDTTHGRLLVFKKTANKPAGGRDTPDLGALCIPGYIAVGW